MKSAVAPAGWGFVPGTLLTDDAYEALPPRPADRSRIALASAIAATPGLADIARPRDLVRKYGMPQSTASTVLQLARRSA